MSFVIKEVIKDDKKPWNIIKVALKEKAKCKTCNTNERREGSSYCLECSNKYKTNVKV
jgi:hypothetical protein